MNAPPTGRVMLHMSGGHGTRRCCSVVLFAPPVFPCRGLSVSQAAYGVIPGRVCSTRAPKSIPPCACDHGFQTRRRGAAKELCDGWYEPGFFAKPVRRLIIHVGKP